MAFENLSERLQKAIRMFRNGGKITEDDLKAPLREVRMALLKRFCGNHPRTRCWRNC